MRNMVRHIVMWKLKEENREENLAEMQRRLMSLPGQVPAIRGTYQAVLADMDRALQANGYHIALIADFADLEELVAYRDHPKHQAVAQFVHEVMEARACIDYPVEQ